MFRLHQHRQAESDLPGAIHASLVQSLYGDPKTLLAGSAGTLVAAFLTAFMSGQPLILACASAMTLVALLRANDVNLFRMLHRVELSPRRARRWELRYVIGASAYVLLMGVWCWLAFAVTEDPVVQLIAFSMTLGNMIGVAGRNYGSRLLVTAQLVCAGVPMLLGLVSTGNLYHLVLAGVLLPFFTSFRTIADRLRLTLTDAVISAKTVQRLADRLDAALNNMSHGLCMFDERGAVVLTNQRLPAILGLDAAELSGARNLRQLARLMKTARLIDRPSLRRAFADARDRLSGQDEAPVDVPLSDGRSLSLTFRVSPNSAVVLVEDVTEQKKSAEKISYLAHFDVLTCLPNRTLFRQQVAQILASTREPLGCAILFVDLDHFKQVNDTLGHPCGDQLLKLVAGRLKAVTRGEDVIARWGGDEFVLVRPSFRDLEEITSLAETIVQEIGRPYEVDGHAVIVGASVGITIGPRDGAEPDILLKHADLALYRAKSAGRGAWRSYEPDMGVEASERRALELDLRAALKADMFELHYQPIVNVNRGRITACEALLRWNHPQRGQVPPSVFVPIAEEMGLIVELGEAVLRKACLEASAWPEDVRVAVNLSATQFRRGDLVGTVRRILRETGMQAGRLELEITESVFLQDEMSTLRILRELRTLGVRISLDDFGTGYSSLSYLQSFPLHKVKVDRSFLQGITSSARSQTLLSGISRLARDLGMSVVVEGVENYEQLDLISRSGDIEEVQGFLLGKPMPAPRMRELLAVFDIANLGEKAAAAGARASRRA